MGFSFFFQLLLLLFLVFSILVCFQATIILSCFNKHRLYAPAGRILIYVVLELRYLYYHRNYFQVYLLCPCSNFDPCSSPVIGSNWFKLACSNWFGLVQIGPKNWFKLVQIGPNWSKLVQIGSNWYPPRHPS